MSDTKAEKQDKITPLIVGALMVVLLAVGMFMNFRSSWQTKPAVDADVSTATSALDKPAN